MTVLHPSKILAPSKVLALLIALLVLGTLLFVVPSLAEEAKTNGPADERTERGRISYRVHCANCHGDAGDGRGPMAEVMSVEPTDLTRLAARNHGTFPTEEVYRAIDGRQEIVAHGRPGMPVWGLGLQDPGRDQDQEPIVREQILDLVAYLETLQEP